MTAASCDSVIRNSRLSRTYIRLLTRTYAFCPCFACEPLSESSERCPRKIHARPPTTNYVMRREREIKKKKRKSTQRMNLEKGGETYFHEKTNLVGYYFWRRRRCGYGLMILARRTREKWQIRILLQTVLDGGDIETR